MTNNRSTNPLYMNTMLIVLASAFYGLVHWRAVGAVWTELELPGPDDFLRLHEVLNLLGGQNWFDISAGRMAPPIGADIHWSRFVDLPIATIIWVFELVVEQQTAVRIAAIFWPFLLFLVGLFATIHLCRLLVPQASPFLVLFFYLLGIATMAETSPGRLDHHNLQILMFVGALSGMISKPSFRSDLLVTLSIVVSLSIGLDSAALFLPLLGLIGVQWALGFENLPKRLLRIGALMMAVSAIVFVSTIPMSKWTLANCDAFSMFYLVALQLLGVAFVVLSFVKLRSIPVRLMIGAFAGASAVVTLLYLFPECASGPYGNVSPELEARWLSKVQEAKGIVQAASLSPERWLGDLVYVMIILVLAIFVTMKLVREKPEWIVLFAAVLICALGLFFQIRILRTGIMASIPFCVLFGVWAWEWVNQQKVEMLLARIAALCLICLPLTSFFWYTAGVLMLKAPATADESAVQPRKNLDLPNKLSCRAQSDYSTLNGLPKSVVMSDINSATPILVHTSHSVISGPYHRNGNAILAVADFFETDETKARKVASDWHVDLVAYCDVKRFDQSKNNSGRLDYRIARNDLPDWLELISSHDETLKVLKVKK